MHIIGIAYVYSLMLRLCGFQAIIWLLGAISWSTIINCWCKAGILSEEWCRELRPTSAAAIAAEAAEEAPLREIASAIQRLPVGYTI